MVSEKINDSYFGHQKIFEISANHNAFTRHGSHVKFPTTITYMYHIMKSSVNFGFREEDS
jgi:hypothetical protein